MPWQNQDLAELYRVRDRLCASGLSVEVEGGVSDEGDPWFVYQQAGTDMVVVHIARIDTHIHVVNCITGTTYTGSTFREVSDRMLDDAPVVLGARVRRASNVVMHPSAFLTAFVAAALMLLDAPGEAKAGEADVAAGDPAHVPSHASEAGHRSEAGDGDATLPAGSASACGRRGQKEGPSSSGPSSLTHVHLAEMAISASMTLSAGLLTNELMHLLRPDGAEQGHEIDASLLAFFVTSSEAQLGASRSAQEAPKAATATAPVLVKAEAHHGVDGIDLHEPNLAGSLPGPQAPKPDDLHLETAANGATELPMPQGQFGTPPTVAEAGSQPSSGAGMAASGKVETPAPEKEASAAAAAATPVAGSTSQEPAHVTSVNEVSATASPTTAAANPAASPAVTQILPVKVDLTLVKATWISASDALPSALAKGGAADDKADATTTTTHPAADKGTSVEGSKLTDALPEDGLASAVLPQDEAMPGLAHDGLKIPPLPAITDAAPSLAPVAEAVPRETVVPVVDTDIHHHVGSDAITLVAGRRDVIHYSSVAQLVLDGFVMGEDVIMFANEATGNDFSATARQVGDDLMMGQGDTIRIVGVLADALHLPAIAA